MNLFNLAQKVTPFKQIPSNIWESFCSEFPLCSQEYLLPTDSCHSQMLAILFASLLDQLVCWCSYQRLDQLNETFKQILQNKHGVSQEILNFYQQIQPFFDKIYSKLRPIDIDKFIKISSQTEKSRLIKKLIEEQQQFIWQLLKQEQEQLAKLARAVALTIYIKPGFENIQYLNQMIKKIPIEQIKNALLTGRTIQNDNFFILEDFEVLPISYQMQVPIFFYINHYDEGSTFLTRRRIHAQNEEQAITFLLDVEEKKKIPHSVRLLSKNHQSVIIRTHFDYLKFNQGEPKLADIIQEINLILEGLSQQTTEQFSKITEFWVKKIVEIIEEGDAQTLITKSNQIELSQMTLRGLQNLTKKLKAESEFSNLKSHINDILQQTTNLFESIVITQITVVRDAIKTHIQKSISTIKSQPRNEMQTIRSSVRQEILVANNTPATKPKILSGNSLFKSSTPNTFSKQKSISSLPRIEAKSTDQDLPDPVENFQNEKIIQEEKEYHTSSDEGDAEEKFNYAAILQDKIKEEVVKNIPNEDEEEQIIKIDDEIDEKREIPLNETSAINIDLSAVLPDKQSVIFSELEKASEIFLDNQNPTPPQRKYGSISFQQQGFSKKANRLTGQYHSNMHQSYSQIDILNFDKDIPLAHTMSVRGQRDSLPFKPNNSNRSKNIRNRMSATQQLTEKKDSFNSEGYERISFKKKDDQGLKTIKEVDNKIEQSRLMDSQVQFVCPICYDSITQNEDIQTIHDDHYACKACIESWIKVKFNAGQWNLKNFTCPIQNQKSIEVNRQCTKVIEENIIRTVLTPEEFDKLCEKAMQYGVININCPNCKVNIRGMPPLKRDGFECPECNIEICWVCKQIAHNGKICPLRLFEIKEALQDERIGCCPVCLEIYMKNEGCQHVSCIKCQIDFCFACSAERDPIMNHGAHYHRVGCEYRTPWLNPDNDEEIFDDEFDPDCCSICKQTEKCCKRPIDLESFKRLAHINF